MASEYITGLETSSIWKQSRSYIRLVRLFDLVPSRSLTPSLIVIQAAWRPIPASEFSFPRSLSPAPAASRDAQLAQIRKISSNASGAASGTASPKPITGGAYRPPGLRNREIPTIFKREDEGGLPYTPSKTNGTEKTGIPGMSGNLGKDAVRLSPVLRLEQMAPMVAKRKVHKARKASSLSSKATGSRRRSLQTILLL
jgi:hypothetical protein